MSINQKIDIFIQFVRKSKRGIFIPLVITSIISVIIVIGGDTFLLFHFYSNMINNYYKNILYDVYDFQDKIISKDSYRRDISSLSKNIIKRIGIKSVWVVDRNGKCIYHSDKSIFEVYLGKNLPLDYYKNINVVWKFKDNYPLIVKNKIKRFNLYRLSIPLYSFGKDYYDFILGIDASFIPIKLSWMYLFIFVGSFIVISSLILFFPLWYFTNKRFDEVSTQAMVLGATLKSEQKGKEEEVSGESTKVEERMKQEENIPEEKAESEHREEKKTYEEIKTKEEIVNKAERKTSTVLTQKKAEKESTEIKNKIKEENNITEKLKKIEEENPNIKLLELKQSIFRRKKNELSSLIIESFPYHSGSVLGSYTTILEKGDIIWPMMFSYYNSEDKIEAYKIIKGIYDYLNDLLEKQDNIKTICSNLNSLYFEKKVKGNFSLIKVSGNAVEYTTLGNDYAIYLKGKEPTVKELILDLPMLGEMKENFEGNVRIADIEFEKNDIFIAMPANAKKISVNNETMDSLIKGYLGENKKDFGKIEDELNTTLKTHFKKNREMEETGFISIRFV